MSYVLGIMKYKQFWYHKWFCYLTVRIHGALYVCMF